MFPVSDVIPSRTTPFVTIALITANTLAFGYELWLDAPRLYALTHTLGLVPAAFSWPSLVTSAFLHDGWIHFGGNMLYLWIFGDNVEDTLGHWPFLLFYLAAAGIGGFSKILRFVEKTAPLRRNVTIDEVGNVAAFLLSDLASAVTGEITYVDCGFSNVAAGMMED